MINIIYLIIMFLWSLFVFGLGYLKCLEDFEKDNKKRNEPPVKGE